MIGLIQSGYYKLTQRLFRGVLKRMLALCGALFTLTFFLLLGQVNNVTFVLAFETLVYMAGIRFVFAGALLLCVLLLIQRMDADNLRGSGVYVTMMLPIPRRHVFFAYCTVGLLCLLMVWAAQLLALFASYPAVSSSCAAAGAEWARVSGTPLPFSVARSNGLFLAILRSDLLHILLPQSLEEGLNSLLLLLAVGCMPAYLVFGERKHRAIFFALAACSLFYWTLSCRFDIILYGADVEAFAWSTTLTGVFLAYMICISVRRLNRDANLV